MTEGIWLDGAKQGAGDVTGRSAVVSQTPTITAGAYSAKDWVGGKLTFDFSSLSPKGQGVTVQSVVIADKSVQRAQLLLYLLTPI